MDWKKTWAMRTYSMFSELLSKKFICQPFWKISPIFLTLEELYHMKNQSEPTSRITTTKNHVQVRVDASQMFGLELFTLSCICVIQTFPPLPYGQFSMQKNEKNQTTKSTSSSWQWKKKQIAERASKEQNNQKKRKTKSVHV
jgi:hypothetical protein